LKNQYWRMSLFWLVHLAASAVSEEQQDQPAYRQDHTKDKSDNEKGGAAPRSMATG